MQSAKQSLTSQYQVLSAGHSLTSKGKCTSYLCALMGCQSQSPLTVYRVTFSVVLGQGPTIKSQWSGNHCVHQADLKLAAILLPLQS